MLASSFPDRCPETIGITLKEFIITNTRIPKSTVRLFSREGLSATAAAERKPNIAGTILVNSNTRVLEL